MAMYFSCSLGCRLLTFVFILLYLARISDGYLINQNAINLSIELVDVETKISPLSVIFPRKQTLVMVHGLSLLGEGSENTMLKYTTFLNDQKVENKTVDVSQRQIISSDYFEAGTIVIEEAGPVSIRVVVSDGAIELEVAMDVNATRPWLVYIPIAVSFGLFLFLKANMIHSLFLAMFVGSWIVEGSLIPGFRAIFNTYLLRAVSNKEHASILLLIVVVSAFSEILNRSGGTNEVLRALSPYTTRTRIAQLILCLAGILFYFDPNVSILMLGKILGSVTKVFPLSSERLSFLIDTTAVPISSIIPGSTWMILVSNIIQNTMDKAGIEMSDEGNANEIVISSIKYQFYPILILFLTVLTIGLGREYGSILKAENRKRINFGVMEKELETTLSNIRRETTKPERSWNWWVPVLLLTVLLWSAFIQLDIDSSETAEAVMSYMTSTWVASVAAALVLVQIFYFFQPRTFVSFRLFGCCQKRSEEGLAFLADTFPSASTSKSEAMENHIDADFGNIHADEKQLEGNIQAGNDNSTEKRCTCLKEPCVLTLREGLDCLFLAATGAVNVTLYLLFVWAMSDVYITLGIDRIASGWILNDKIGSEALPTVTFFSSMFLSIVLGSSELTISIVFPIIMSAFFVAAEGNSETLAFLVAMALSGAVTGDHIGPFSVTTILSGTVTDSGVLRHFATQLPYALVILVLSVLVGTLPLSFGTYPEFFGFFIGFVVIAIFAVVVCRRLEKPRFVPGRGGEAITTDFHRFAKQQQEETLSFEHVQTEGLILQVNTEDLLDKEENQTVANFNPLVDNDSRSASDDIQTPAIQKYSLQSFKSKLSEINSRSGDPIMGLVEEGLLPSDNKKEHRSVQNEQGDGRQSKRDPEASANAAFENKKRLIEATIKESEKDGNIFSDSLRMFLRTAEVKLDKIMSDEGLGIIKPTESGESAEDSLDNLMHDIAAKGWRSAMEEVAGDLDDATEVTGAVEEYTTAGGYTTDGFGSVMGDTDDSGTASTSSSGRDGQSTEFSASDNDTCEHSYSNEETTSTATSNGPSLTASEGTSKMDPARIQTSLFDNSRKAFSAWITADASSDDDGESAKEFTKASF